MTYVCVCICHAAGEMNEATGKSAPLQETTSGSPSASESGMELGLNSWFPAYGFHAPQLQLQIHAAPGHYQPNFQPTHEDIRSNGSCSPYFVYFCVSIILPFCFPCLPSLIAPTCMPLDFMYLLWNTRVQVWRSMSLPHVLIPLYVLWALRTLNDAAGVKHRNFHCIYIICICICV